MCFSAPASFAASVLLAAAGGSAMALVKEPRQKLFAAIPLLFAVQQLAEGFLWLALRDPAHAVWEAPATMVFLQFAQVVWPLWLPLSVLLIEPEDRRRRWLMLTLAAGMFTAAYMLLALSGTPPVAAVAHHHVHYTIVYPSGLRDTSSAFYLLATVVPLFLSSERRMWTLGLAVLLSLLTARIFYADNVISVWCYFAALISTIILFLVAGMRRSSMRQAALAQAT